MRPTQGVTFGGRYELDSRIAVGGMGEVWEATDHVIGRTVAIKILKDEYMGDPGFLERFRAEARHAALVNHEGIASVFDYGEENGSAFLVMELVPGEALSTILERDGALSTDRTLDVVAQTAAALQAAHSAGLVHRDIKPGNLLITPDGRVKITDFGIARIADQVPLTATGQVMGTVQYLSPEQASGHPASAATDIYSLGIVAYESLAGKRPFTGESQVAIAMAQINDDAPPLEDTIPRPVQGLVFAMIAKKPEDRPASAAAVSQAASALRRGDVATAAATIPLIASEGAVSTTTSVIATESFDDGATTIITATETDTDAKPKKRSSWTWPLIALIVLLLLVLGGTVFALFFNNNGNDDAVVSPSVSPSLSPSVSPSPSESRINVPGLGLVGLSCEAASVIAAENQLIPVCVDGAATSNGSDVGNVYEVNPMGNVNPGSEITLRVYSPAPVVEIPAPRAAPFFTDQNASALTALTANADAQIGWSAFTCPAGAEPLSGYVVKLSNASFADGTTTQTFGSGILNAKIKAFNSPGTNATASFTASCGDAVSPASPTATIPIISPEPAPDPNDDEG